MTAVTEPVAPLPDVKVSVRQLFGFDSDGPAKQVPKEAACYSCHEQHAAVDTTFVQFYPTLIELAKKKGTLSANYLKDEAANAKK